MARVLAISSWVAVGHVGLSAATAALQALGSSVIGLPTVLLSSHKGLPPVAGDATPAAQLREMLAAIETHGWLEEADAALTGYLPTVEHVALAAEAISATRAAHPAVLVVVDPVLGDDPGGLYVPADVAAAVRARLVPLADVLTPNRFEISWLSGAPADDARQAIGAARRLLREMRPNAQVVITSAPFAAGWTGALRVGPDDATAWRTSLRPRAPHGVGDVFSALLAGGLTPGAATGMLAAMVDAAQSDGPASHHLPIIEAAPSWTTAPPVYGSPVEEQLKE